MFALALRSILIWQNSALTPLRSTRRRIYKRVLDLSTLLALLLRVMGHRRARLQIGSMTLDALALPTRPGLHPLFLLSLADVFPALRLRQ